MDSVPENFEQLPLAKAESQTSLSGQYRVYTDHKNFKTVQANSASNALEVSGLTQAVKIEREAMHKHTLIKPKLMSEGEATPPADGAAPAA